MLPKAAVARAQPRADAAREKAFSARGDEPGDEVLALRVRVRNVGRRAGAEVVQLYLAYPAEAGEPALVLRDYRKTPQLQPGEAVDLHFSLTSRGLSVWRGGWSRVRGSFTALIGRSSRNHSLSHRFES